MVYIMLLKIIIPQIIAIKEMSLITLKVEDMDMSVQGEINFESVDTIVTSQLQQIDSQQYDSKLMLEIYNNL